MLSKDQFKYREDADKDDPVYEDEQVVAKVPTYPPTEYNPRPPGLTPLSRPYRYAR